MPVSLADQLGAMALIDDMRGQRMLVQQHVDIPERRREVAKRIADYYASRSIEVSTKEIEEGVKAFFSSRLTFEEPKRGPLTQRLVQLYLVRDRWLKKAVVTAMVVCGLTGGAFYTRHEMDVSRTNASMAQMNAAIELHKTLTAQLLDYESLMKGHEEAVKTQQPPKSLSRILDSARPDLDKVRSLLSIVLAAPNPLHAQEQTASLQFKQENATLAQAQSLLKESIEPKFSVATELMSAFKSYTTTCATAPFLGALARYPAVMLEKKSAVLLALEQADTKGVAPATAALKLLDAAVVTSSQMEPFDQQITSAVHAFADMKLSSGDQSIANDLVQSARKALSSLDDTKARAALTELNAGLQYAQSSLTFNIVDRAGIKSGVERNYKGSGGKSWFVIAEATDALNVAHEVPIKSVETGRKAFAKLFGVRVAYDEYLRVKADKQADGHVDNRVIGTKPANTFAIKFSSRIYESPDTILEW